MNVRSLALQQPHVETWTEQDDKRHVKGGAQRGCEDKES